MRGRVAQGKRQEVETVGRSLMLQREVSGMGGDPEHSCKTSSLERRQSPLKLEESLRVQEGRGRPGDGMMRELLFHSF